jgi:Restriction endonuclease
VPETEQRAPVWGEGERPNWLVPDELQPKKREWSPARDRMEAELELKARLREQRHLRRRNVLRFVFLPFIWLVSLVQAMVAVGRNQPDVVEAPRPTGAHPHSTVASLDTLPSLRPHLPVGETATGPVIGWAPPPTAEVEPVAYEVPTATEPEAPVEHPPVDWPDTVEPVAPTAEVPTEEIPAPAPQAPLPPQPTLALPPQPTMVLPPQPTMVLPPKPLPAQPTQQLGAGEMVGVILGTCVRSCGAEVGVLVLLQDDVLVVRGTIGIDPETAAHLALETLGDVCLDVIGGLAAVRAYDANPGAPDPYHPRAVLCVPVLLGGVGVGAVLLVGYAPGRPFSVEHERLATELARTSGPVLAKAGAYKLVLDRPGDRWRRLDQVGTGAAPAAPAPAEAPAPTEHDTGEIVGSPMSTMTLDPEAMRRLIADAKAARAAEEAVAVAPLVVEPVVEPQPAPPQPLPEPVEVPEPEPTRASWRERVSSRMTRVARQKEEDRIRYRTEIGAAVRNLSWDGYQALIADIYRRKAFEVFPPPVSGSDLDVIDLVVDRDNKRMLINCQLRGEMDIPAAAVTEMGNVVSNYSVAGAYLIADGSFAQDAVDAAPAAGVVLIDGEALIDLVIETTLKDESKPSGFGRLAQRFRRAS